jgi:hypothetical protein
MNSEEAQKLLATRPLLKCGCVAQTTYEYQGQYGVACIVHDCKEVVEKPSLEGRKARCSYYGKPVKGGGYNSNCCPVCKVGEVCKCERPSNYDLWFFEHKPDKEYDEFYCACHGAD